MQSVSWSVGALIAKANILAANDFNPGPFFLEVVNLAETVYGAGFLGGEEALEGVPAILKKLVDEVVQLATKINEVPARSIDWQTFATANVAKRDRWAGRERLAKRLAVYAKFRLPPIYWFVCKKAFNVLLNNKLISTEAFYCLEQNDLCNVTFRKKKSFVKQFAM